MLVDGGRLEHLREFRAGFTVQRTVSVFAILNGSFLGNSDFVLARLIS